MPEQSEVLEAKLPFDLPEHLECQRGNIVGQATDMTARVEGLSFDEAARIAAWEINRRVDQMYALARIATNPDSLAYRLRQDPRTWQPLAQFDPWARN